MKFRSVGTRAVVCAVAVGCVPASAAANAPLHWSHIAHVGHNGISALACPSTTLCVAGSTDGLLVSSDPGGPASTWQLVFVPPASGHMAPQVTSVSCPSPRFCAAVTLGGDLLTSSDPSGGPSAWTLTSLHIPVGQFPNAFIPQVSCSSASQCVAISTGSRMVFSTSDPGGGVDMWKSVKFRRTLQTVACSGPDLCVLGDDRGDVRTSTDPTRGAKAWSFAHIFGKPGFVEDLHTATCGSERYCLITAIGLTGTDYLILATKPTVTTPRTRGAWQDNVAVSTAGFVSGSCAGTFCAYGEANGTVDYPSRSFRTLTRTRVYRSPSGSNAPIVSCASKNWCALGTSRSGDVYIGTG